MSAATDAADLDVMQNQGKTIDKDLTKAEYTQLLKHLHNDNPPYRFVMGFRTDRGEKRYVRSKTKPADRVISWSWDTIQGRAKSGIAFVPYSANEKDCSRWGAFDFDAHDGNDARAKKLAMAAFRELREPLDVERYVILETSGAGWHLWIVLKEFRPVNWWVRLLKSIAQKIGASIQPGECEIFPPDSNPGGYGKGMRAPGSWNPGTETVNSVISHNLEDLLRQLVQNSVSSALSHLTDTERNNLLLSTTGSLSQPHLYHLWPELWCKRFAIDQPSSRNAKLTALVAEIFFQVGHDMARRIVEEQFNRRTVSTAFTLEHQLGTFSRLWRGLRRTWLVSLSAPARQAFESLATEHEEDAFRIVLSYHRKAVADGRSDFAIAAADLANRIGITLAGAVGIRKKLETLRIITMTERYQPNRRAARYRWLVI